MDLYKQPSMIIAKSKTRKDRGLQDFQNLKKASQQIPVLWSSNMSVGVNFLNGLLKHFKSLKGFDFQIEEVHHRHKKDAPSGTALTLQKTLQSAVETPLPEALAIRGGGVFGIHKVWAIADEEVLTFEHQALNRKVFAKGAVAAARWIAGQPPGYYSMLDVLGLE